MDFSNLADELIAKGEALNRPRTRADEYLERIREVSPSVYKRAGMLWHEHEPLSRYDSRAILALIDDPGVRMSVAEQMWIYNRLEESAPELSERYIRVSREYVWDSKTGELLDAKRVAKKGWFTLSDKDTRRMRDETNTNDCGR